ncbi:hypothetical protein SEA_ARCADIA_34 [Arthrobacter phage Arcadia]|uniref:Uncharacterized protein n=2 Tax=Mudcatvirus TaxID=1982088 RepID=A0A222Z669_9CAUD|nr:hypothetical protein PQB74_gp34 [Arthrobacter phage Arcadia]YP_010666119.1 hypothetical protein PQB75_gp034 [Arthrobacter phage Tribby]ASR80191.1 hypothetical protein SEA_ELSA_34 [Arthrobacter phage Elsa]ASR80388.1 hypothetical protein SEA_NASON_34 [Arthrobacter phage Nason]UYL87297.1 hypothetical protein SEA_BENITOANTONIO_34 [Arthrobacter phage BenitoAntonio]ASR79998.1 hypothetical protein SEA_ARCADIA_34 [Arthrobacter phage Arcadia]ASR80485.1 hypothetical protein SEA_TRIBBY_34 [Arthrobact
MDTEEIETDETNIELDAAQTVALVLIAGSLLYTGYRVGKLAENLIRTSLEHRREKKAQKEEK